MAVAGIKPVGYTNDKFMGPGEESNTNIVTGELLSVDLPQGIPLFTDEQVREILIKFANAMIEQEDMFQERVGDSNMYVTTDESLARGIDKFMDGD
ncbi:hypothetical protein K1728_00710 [Weissella confusa]|uniref:hypothetical protein n=1 Tax=Weissella confusa TaxID=1583 RepID=UPI001C6FC037|nr:hypothetical protein [Weissella confusa]QYU57966.1 hypothetical protein K1728_00710 [Weissella confusa]